MKPTVCRGIKHTHTHTHTRSNTHSHMLVKHNLSIDDILYYTFLYYILKVVLFAKFLY